MPHTIDDVPWGIKVVRRLGRCFPTSRGSKDNMYRSLILVLTFLTYTSYHMSRKPISVVKNVLNRNCSGVAPTYDVNITENNLDSWCDWAPFGNFCFFFLCWWKVAASENLTL